MDRIGIALIGMPRILRDVITSIVEGQPDMQIVGEVPEDAAIDAVEALGASFVTVGLGRSDELPAAAARVLAHRSSIRVLGLSSEGRRGFLYELRPHMRPIGEVSPEVLLSTIRAPVRFDASDGPSTPSQLPT